MVEWDKEIESMHVVDRMDVQQLVYVGYCAGEAN